MHQGSEHLEVLGDLRTNPDDTPFQRVTVTRAGARWWLRARPTVGMHTCSTGTGTPHVEDVLPRPR